MDYLNKVVCGNCLETIKEIPDNSVNCCVTSPPYWGLRDYGTGKWIGGDPNCSHKRDNKWSPNSTINTNKELAVCDAIYKDVCPKCGAIRVDTQMGLEKTPEEYVAKLVTLFREVRRVLKKDGTLWLNLGDSYVSGKSRYSSNVQTISGGKDRGEPTDSNKPDLYYHPTLKDKDLCGIPWLVAFALQEDGWYLRQDIIWHKPNPMPESVTDRCTKAHEYIFLLSKSSKYYFDNEAIEEPIQDGTALRMLRGVSDTHKNVNGAPGQTPHTMNQPRPNIRKAFTDKMGGAGTGFVGHSGYRRSDGSYIVSPTRNKRSVWTVNTKPFVEAHFATFPEALISPCIIAGCPPKGTVLDPFMGAGTVAIVAKRNDRNFIGCELNPEYIKLTYHRLEQNKLTEEDLWVKKKEENNLVRKLVRRE
jgi:DNA modification methylase